MRICVKRHNVKAIDLTSLHITEDTVKLSGMFEILISKHAHQQPRNNLFSLPAGS